MTFNQETAAERVRESVFALVDKKRKAANKDVLRRVSRLYYFLRSNDDFGAGDAELFEMFMSPGNMITCRDRVRLITEGVLRKKGDPLDGKRGYFQWRANLMYLEKAFEVKSFVRYGFHCLNERGESLGYSPLPMHASEEKIIEECWKALRSPTRYEFDGHLDVVVNEKDTGGLDIDWRLVIMTDGERADPILMDRYIVGPRNPMGGGYV